ncbi:hypothetical protein F8388_016025 [Cannabis sativa]|uniref:Uncharacterized protein n=1 Tax=Cannabis sativa TaxID=3483 RepID=A0A7J6FUM9_CANSA|nr:hypothetical protein F8388_016025 [Cannabis sativa]
MAMPWGMTLWMTKMVWLALSGWVSSCLIVADEIATSFRTGDISPFHDPSEVHNLVGTWKSGL